jgi:cell division protein ZapD
MSQAAIHITYFEQPLNDPMRICLRLEQLFINLEDNLEKPDPLNSQAALAGLARVMDVIDRPDLKSKLMQTLMQIHSTLSHLQPSPDVDHALLNDMLQKVDSYITFLLHAKIGEKSRHNEFLKHLRLQFNNPGGPCSYKSPSHHLWLELPAAERIKHLKIWREEFVALEDLVNLILKITRERAKIQQVLCEKGFYHQNLDPNSPIELIRVGIPTDAMIYPEISAGRHRLSIRLLKPDFMETGRAAQIDENFPVELFCCKN